MPMYEYACRDCDHTFVARRNSTERDHPLNCPTCESARVGRQLATFMIGPNSAGAASSAANEAAAAAGPARRAHSFGCPCCA